MSDSQGPESMSNDQPMTDEDRKKLIIRAYEHLKSTFEKFKKPDGSKKSPAKTCRDIKAAYPDLKSGECYDNCLKSGFQGCTM